MAKSSKSTSEFEEYFRWIDEIKKETIEILDQREIYREYLRIVKNNKKILNPPTFHFWIRKNYAHCMAISVRRQLEVDNKSVSLMKLLQRIKQRPNCLTKEWYVSLFAEKSPPKEDAAFWKRHGSEVFKNEFGKKGFFDPLIAQADIEKLKQLGNRIQEYANERIAHHQELVSGILPTYGNLDEFIDELKKIVEKYLLLFEAISYDLTPTHQENWKEVLTRPWIKNNNFKS